MTTWTDPPAIITQLRTQLVACASWSTGINAVNYPELPVLSGATFPLALLSEGSRTFDTYADGAAPLAGGMLQVVIHSTGTIGVTEALGRTILSELLAQWSGIPFRPGDCGLSSDPSPAKVAGGSSYRTITLNLAWGLSP